MFLLLKHRSNSPSLKAGQDNVDSLSCKAMREQVRLWLGPQGFRLPGPGAVGQQRHTRISQLHKHASRAKAGTKGLIRAISQCKDL